MSAWSAHAGGRPGHRQEVRDKAQELLAGGMSKTDVANKLGIPRSTVATWAKKPVKQQVLPEPKKVKLYLILDNSRELGPRRNADCARLYPCENAWVWEYGSSPARCPDGCEGFLKREL